MTETSDKQINALLPKDESLREYRRVIGTALRVMAGGGLPKAEEVEAKAVADAVGKAGEKVQHLLLGRRGSGEQVPAVLVRGKEFDGTVVVWVHPEGKAKLLQDGKLVPEAKKVLDSKAAILVVDVFETGELKGDKLMPIDGHYAGFTFGYNRPLVANRVHDILTAVAFAASHEKTKKVHLVGFEAAGPWVMLARGLCGDKVARTAADVNSFRYEKVRRVTDEMMLPGALKYGGLGALVSLAAPGELLLHNNRGTGIGKWTKAVYGAAKATDRLKKNGDKLEAVKVVEWLLR
jgi:hypothetical protein